MIRLSASLDNIAGNIRCFIHSYNPHNLNRFIWFQTVIYTAVCIPVYHIYRNTSTLMYSLLLETMQVSCSKRTYVLICILSHRCLHVKHDFRKIMPMDLYHGCAGRSFRFCCSRYNSFDRLFFAAVRAFAWICACLP